MNAGQEKKCFIATPIGSDTDPIRRHIEGIIEAAICPALEKKYKIIVAHKIYEPGSITKQVISEIYNAELVIANLTDRNPNVMYELAFRHSLGKPVIMIAESGTSLPADIIMERTIFYQNDAQGVLELKKALVKAESEIDFSKVGSPIHDVLHSIYRDKDIIQLSQNNSQTEQEVLPYILDKLNKLEDAFLANRPFKNTISPPLREWKYEFSLPDASEKNANINYIDFFCKFGTIMRGIPEIEVCETTAGFENRKCTVYFNAMVGISRSRLKASLEKALADAGIVEICNPRLVSALDF